LGSRVSTNMNVHDELQSAYLASLAGATYVRACSAGAFAHGPTTRVRSSAKRGHSGRKLAEPDPESLDSAFDGRNEALQVARTSSPCLRDLRKMLWNPRTESTIEEFNTAWRNRTRS